MYCAYQDREELEDDLYQEDDGDSDGSEANSELEFRLYSQLHYSSNAGEMEGMEEDGEEKDGELRDIQKQEVIEKIEDADTEPEPTAESQPPSPAVEELLKKKKKVKGDKLDKKKKGKSDAKGQQLPASFFEEVIVIDSSPDVISISEDDSSDDNSGVCASKGQGLHRLQTSTPSQQETRKRTWPVTVGSSSSESDSSNSEESESESESESDSSDSSDSSDVLESWMILGRGKQDGDQSISLNLEGGSVGSADAEEEGGSWLVSDKDKEAQIYNKDKGARVIVQRTPNRYYTDKNVHCRNCNKTGHLSKNCPDPKKLLMCFLCGIPGHMVIECPSKHCNNCGLPGHLYESCCERAYWHKQCHRCGMTGHFFDACPEIWRQYHITTKTGPPVKQQGEDHGRSPAYCYNCSRKGHFGHACTQQRMFRGVYPSTPFINHYDTMGDIKSRQHRTKFKVKDLKKNGLFPALSQTPPTPGPPKKRQKNNHQPNQTPHQTPNHHKPNPNHIFFNDNHDFGGATPKANKKNKFKQQEHAGSVKPWKPKRPVPTSRHHTPNKLILDEADDFPRGGAAGESAEKKKRRKMNQMKQGPSEGHTYHTPDHLFSTVGRKRQGPKGEKKKGRNSRAKKLAPMYPADENLFIIKQRKRRR